MLLRSRMRLGFLFALVVFCIVLTGKSFAQDSELSADEIIQILQENPDVLAEAKAEIVNQLRDRGYNVSERDITDDRLFSQIRSDDRVRQLAANELAKRGFGPPGASRPPTNKSSHPASNQASKTVSRQASKPASKQSAAISSRTRQRPGTTGAKTQNRPAGVQRTDARHRQPQQARGHPRTNILFATCRPCAIFIPRPLWTKPNWSALAPLFFAIAQPRQTKLHFECSRRPGLCPWSRR